MKFNAGDLVWVDDEIHYFCRYGVGHKAFIVPIDKVGLGTTGTVLWNRTDVILHTTHEFRLYATAKNVDFTQPDYLRISTRKTPSPITPKGVGSKDVETAKDRFKRLQREFFNNCVSISESKNADYTGGDSDPFANFTSVEQLHIPTEVGFITRMNDKMMRIASFVKNGELEVKDESVEDTLNDLANYCSLFSTYLKMK